MSGTNPFEPRLRGMRRHNQTTVKVEEKRLQRLLDFIDARCQSQRFRLKKQIEDTQQIAEDTEEKKHKATLQLLKGYFEVTSGRVRTNDNPMYEERMLGVLSEPSMLPIVPEVDPDVLTAPRSMYDKVARGLDTTRLPMLAPHKRSFMMTQAMNQPPKSLTESSGSASEHNTKSTTSSSAKSNPSDRSTPRNEVTPINTPETGSRRDQTRQTTSPRESDEGGLVWLQEQSRFYSTRNKYAPVSIACECSKWISRQSFKSYMEWKDIRNWAFKLSLTERTYVSKGCSEAYVSFGSVLGEWCDHSEARRSDPDKERHFATLQSEE